MCAIIVRLLRNWFNFIYGIKKRNESQYENISRTDTNLTKRNANRHRHIQSYVYELYIVW